MEVAAVTAAENSGGTWQSEAESSFSAGSDFMLTRCDGCDAGSDAGSDCCDAGSDAGDAISRFDFAADFFRLQKNVE
jgi:hypothetical protein